jgi:hypothetical protein
MPTERSGGRRDHRLRFRTRGSRARGLPARARAPLGRRPERRIRALVDDLDRRAFLYAPPTDAQLTRAPPPTQALRSESPRQARVCRMVLDPPSPASEPEAFAERTSLARQPGLEPATRRLTEEGGAAQSDELRAVEASGQSGDGDDDPACFTVHQNDSSGIVNETWGSTCPAYTGGPESAGSSSNALGSILTTFRRGVPRRGEPPAS